ncbi:MAG TPA: hemolysin family protein [bacterium]
MKLLLLLLLIFISGAYFSAMETAYTAFDRILTFGWMRARRFGARTVHFLSAHPQRFLGTTLIGNNVTNVAYSSLLVVLAKAAGIGDFWLLTLSPLAVLVFSELLPKTVGYALANRIVRRWSFPMLACYYLFTPIRWLLWPMTRLLTSSAQPVDQLVSGEPLAMRRELDMVLVGAEAEGAVSPEEGELLERFLDARELKVRQIMTPRTQMVAVSLHMTPAEVRDVFRRSRYNILPVYDGDLDHIVGFISARDFLADLGSLRDVLRPLHAVPESKRIVDLLQEFKVQRRRVALVVDEYGGTDGLVTLADIFAELVGPVGERFDPDQAVIKRVAPGKFLVSGSAFLEDIEQVTGWPPPEGEYNTLSGLLADRLGRIPNAGEDVDIDGVAVRVLQRTPRRVEGCLLKLPLSAPEDED